MVARLLGSCLQRVRAFASFRRWSARWTPGSRARLQSIRWWSLAVLFRVFPHPRSGTYGLQRAFSLVRALCLRG